MTTTQNLAERLHECSNDTRRDIQPAVRALLAEAASALRSRDSVIEECARAAERFAEANRKEPGSYSEGRAHAGEAIAAHIRSLSSHAETAGGFDLIAYLGRQWPWSKKTFGPGDRTAGVLDHIRKELTEIEADPDDLLEWVDVVILAMDGVWRRGFTAEQFCAALQAKQDKNFARQWPDWRTQPTDKAIEHVRTESPAMIKAAKGGEK